jgi:hypothetical protein
MSRPAAGGSTENAKPPRRDEFAQPDGPGSDNCGRLRQLREENEPMKSGMACSATIALLASTQFAAAQGPAGGTGAIASIPGYIVRAEPGQPVPQQGILSIITTPPGSNADARQRATRRGENPMPQR